MSFATKSAAPVASLGSKVSMRGTAVLRRPAVPRMSVNRSRSSAVKVLAGADDISYVMVKPDGVQVRASTWGDA